MRDYRKVFEEERAGSAPLRDGDIRNALISVLQLRDSSAAIIQEQPIWRGRGRADVVFVNGELCGFEIKSERDSLRRLGDQVVHYDSVFEYATVVVAKCHLRGVRGIVPRRWGIAVAVSRDGCVVIRHVRGAKRNSAADMHALARLLWKRECVRALANQSVKADVSMPLRELWQRVAAMSADVLFHEVREALKRRKSAARPSQCDGSRTTEATE